MKNNTTLKVLLEQKTKLERRLCKTNNFEEKIKINYNIGRNLAYIILLNKNLMEIKKIIILEKELQIKQIKQKIKIAKINNDNTDYLLSLYQQLGLKVQWIKIVKQKFKQI